MKRICSILLAILLPALLFFGCSIKEPPVAVPRASELSSDTPPTILSQRELTLSAGEFFYIDSILTDKDADYTCTISDDSIVKQEEGKLHALSAGTATLTMTIHEQSEALHIIVTEASSTTVSESSSSTLCSSGQTVDSSAPSASPQGISSPKTVSPKEASPKGAVSAPLSKSSPSSELTSSQPKPSTQPAPSSVPQSSQVQSSQNTVSESSENQPSVQKADTDAYNSSVISLINSERKKKGLSQLTKDPVLMSAAKIRAEELAFENGGKMKVNGVAHVRLDGRSCYTAIDEAVTNSKMAYLSCLENLGEGYESPSTVMNGWMNSKLHKDHILYDRNIWSAYVDNPVDSIGVGCAQSKSGRLIWVFLSATVGKTNERTNRLGSHTQHIYTPYISSVSSSVPSSQPESSAVSSKSSEPPIISSDFTPSSAASDIPPSSFSDPISSAETSSEPEKDWRDGMSLSETSVTLHSGEEKSIYLNSAEIPVENLKLSWSGAMSGTEGIVLFVYPNGKEGIVQAKLPGTGYACLVIEYQGQSTQLKCPVTVLAPQS